MEDAPWRATQKGQWSKATGQVVVKCGQVLNGAMVPLSMVHGSSRDFLSMAFQSKRFV